MYKTVEQIINECKESQKECGRENFYVSLFRLVEIYTENNEDTIHDGDRLAALKLARQIDSGKV